MKKVFALMVVFAALFAVGCAEKQDTMPPPAEDQAVPADETKEMPAEEPAETP